MYDVLPGANAVMYACAGETLADPNITLEPAGSSPDGLPGAGRGRRAAPSKLTPEPRGEIHHAYVINTSVAKLKPPRMTHTLTHTHTLLPAHVK